MMEGQKESPEYSVYAVKNARRLMEDRHVVIPNLLSQFTNEGDNHYSYYAIFDGHAGPDAAEFAADNVHKNLVESSFFKSGNISDAFRYAYATTDFQYTEKSSRDGIKAGCTAVTCLLENNRRLYMAWVGDSVALLSRNGKPYFIMEPHNLERDDEKERVEAMGGTVLYFDTWRVNGTLGVSRAIGDPEYKPYVCADPDIECIDLDGTEDFLVIGCDGLWDRMTPEDAIGLIYEHLQTNSHLSVNELVNSTAQILSDKSISDGSGDNVTTIVLFLKDVSSILESFLSSSSSAATSTSTATATATTAASYNNVGSASTLNGFHGNSVVGAGGVESFSSFSSSSNNYTLDNNGYNNNDYGNNNTHNNSNGNIIDNEDTITATTASSTTTSTTCTAASSYNMNISNNMNSYPNNNGLVHGMDNGMMRGEEEVIGSGGKSGGLDLEREREEEEEEKDGRRRAEGGVGGGGDEKLVDREKEKEEKENSGSTLNPFADAFEPNISSASNSSKNNIIGSSGEFGNEPKKDYDVNEGDVESESTNRNERLDKKDLWMSEFKDDGNNDQHQHQLEQQHHQYQHDHKQEEEEKGKGKEEEEEEEGIEKYSKQQKEMFDGSMDNGLSYSGKKTGDGVGDGVGLDNQESTGNLSSSEYSDNLSSEMIIHDDIEHENKFGNFEAKPSAPELVFIEGDQQQQRQLQQDQSESQYSAMDDNLISQAETFVGNLTPNECPSSPIATNFDAHYEFTTTAEREEITTTSSNLISTSTSTTTSASTINENVNQYITTVSDGMVSDPYHHDNEFFGSDSVEPVSMIVNESNDVISSGPHAIDPYLLSSLQSSSSSSSVKEDKLEYVSTKGVDGCLVGGEKVEGDALVNSSTGKINIEDTQSIPLESLNPFDGGNDNNSNDNNNVGIVNDELGVDISTGDETKGSFYEDNPDNSSGLLDFSDDQVNTIVITPNASGYQLDESSLMMMNSSSSSIGGTDVDLLSENRLKEQLSNVNIMSEQKEKEKEMKTCEAEEGKAEKLSGIDVKESKYSGKEEVEEQAVSTIIEATGSLINQINENENKNENEKFDSKSSQLSSQGVDTSNAAAAVTAVGSSVIAAAAAAGIAGVAVASKAKSTTTKTTTTTTTTGLAKKDAVGKTNVVKKSTLLATKNSTISRSTTATTTTASRATSSTTRKPLTSTTTTSASSRLTSSVKSSSSLGSSKLSTSRQPTSTSTTSTSNVKNSTSTSRIGITSNLNKRPTQASATSTSSTTTASRVSSLASRTTTSALAARKPGIGSSSSSSSSPSSTTTSKPLSRTAGSTTTTTTRSTLGTSRLTTTTKPSTISSTSSSSSTARTGTGTGTGTGTTRTSGTISKRASTGTMLNRPSPSASSTLNTKSTSSALNRSLTNSSSSRSGASSTTTSTLSKLSTRPSTTSSRLASSSSSTSTSSQLSKTSSRAPLAGRTSGTKSSTTTTAASKPTTSSNKVPVPRLGIKKTPSSSTDGSATTTTTTTSTTSDNRNECSSSSPLLIGNTGSADGPTTTTTTTTPGTIIMDNLNSEQGTNCSTPVDGTITNSIKRDKNLMPNSTNSLKDELEAALASPISCEDKGVIKETKDDE